MRLLRFLIGLSHADRFFSQRKEGRLGDRATLYPSAQSQTLVQLPPTLGSGPALSSIPSLGSAGPTS